MSYSLFLRNGDISPSGPGGLATVTSTQKLVQDLRNHTLEPRGTDPMHPGYGSTLDGGVNPDGSIPETNIGEMMSRERLMNIESEIRRVCFAHQGQQIDQIKREMARYGGKHTMTPGELLSAIERIDVTPFQDVVLARCHLRVESGGLVSLTQPV